MKRTKIVCTIGPASESPEKLKQLMETGMNVCRLNFSHGDHEEHLGRIESIKKVSMELNKHVAIMLDTKGPEIRIGTFENKATISLAPGDKFTFTTREVVGNQGIVSVSYKDLPKDVFVGARILVDDGLVEFVVDEIDDTEIHTTVVNYGEIKDRKGLNTPSVSINLPALTEKDIDDIKFGVKQGIDFIAASFVRKADDVLAIRKVLEECEGGEKVQIISKIESEEGVDNLDEIIEVSDGIMVARGDLGVEVSNERVPLVQKEIIRKCNLVGKPVITATQMLDSMIRNPRPTRAEINDVANAILDGSDAIMLSGETAAGKYPLEAVETMVRVAQHIETSIDYKKAVESRIMLAENDPTNAISNSVSRISQQLKANAILAATASGSTAKAIAKFRPESPIIATTHNADVARKLSLTWGVEPIHTRKMELTDQLIDNSISEGLRHGYIKEGDLVVVTAGIPASTPGTTNMLKVHTVAKILAKGQAIGKGSVVGKAVLVKSVEDLENKFKAGDIIVADFTDATMIPFIEKSSGLIVREGGLTSHAAITALHYRLPAIIGADIEKSTIKDGDEITLDALAGIVYEGAAKVM